MRIIEISKYSMENASGKSSFCKICRLQASNFTNIWLHHGFFKEKFSEISNYWNNCVSFINFFQSKNHNISSLLKLIAGYLSQFNIVFLLNVIGPSSNANDEDDALFIVIGICGGLGLISIIIIIVVVFCWYRRRQQKSESLIILFINLTLSWRQSQKLFLIFLFL